MNLRYEIDNNILKINVITKNITECDIKQLDIFVSRHETLINNILICGEISNEIIEYVRMLGVNWGYTNVSC